MCLVLIGLVLVTSEARADGDAPCESPRAAAVSFLGGLDPANEDLGRATACFDWQTAAVRPGERAALARKLKRLLDARGYWVDVDALPRAHDADGAGAVPLTARMPELVLVPRGGRWVFDAAAIGRIDAWYAETFPPALAAFVERLPPWMHGERRFGVAPWKLLGLLLTVLVGAGVRFLMARVIAHRAGRTLARAGIGGSLSSVERAARPAGTLAGTLLFTQILPLLELPVRIARLLGISAQVLATLAGVLVVYRLVDVASDVLARRAERTATKLDDQLVPLVRRASKVFVTLVGSIFVLQNFDVDVSSLLAGASIGGLAFSLAARDTVANLFGSVSIFADRPFQVGDWIVVGDKEGIVLEVGMRTTRMRAFDSSVVTIPNSELANSTVVNFGLREARRQVMTLTISYGSTVDQIEAFVDGIRAVLRAHPAVRKDGYEVHFRNFGDSALEIFVYFFLNVSTWSDELAERHRILLDLMRLAESLGVRFAFPTRTLHIEAMAEAAANDVRSLPTREELMARAASFGPGARASRPSGKPLASPRFLAEQPLVASDFDRDDG